MQSGKAGFSYEEVSHSSFLPCAYGPLSLCRPVPTVHPRTHPVTLSSTIILFSGDSKWKPAKQCFLPPSQRWTLSPASPSLASPPAPLQRTPDHSEVCYVSLYSLEILTVTLRILPAFTSWAVALEAAFCSPVSQALLPSELWFPVAPDSPGLAAGSPSVCFHLLFCLIDTGSCTVLAGLVLTE